MILRPHPAHRLIAMLAGAGRSSILSLGFVVSLSGLAGCRHKAPPFDVSQIAMAPVDLQALPEDDDPPMIDELEEPTPPATFGIATPPPVRRRRPAAPTPPPPAPPVQVAAADPAVLAIGALSSGGDATVQSQQEARNLIATIYKRIAALPAKTAGQQKSQLRQVSQFLKQAEQALNSGDAEGAKTLATKAKLLMDDMEKK